MSFGRGLTMAWIRWEAFWRGLGERKWMEVGSNVEPGGGTTSGETGGDILGILFDFYRFSQGNQGNQGHRGIDLARIVSW